MKAINCILCLVWLCAPAWAVEPNEVLSDPALEQRARNLSQQLRCLVCRNESIDESNAGLARDLRLLVRERLETGDSDTEVMNFVVTRYGEYVLLKPDSTGANWLLWASGPLTLLFAAGVVVSFSRRRAKDPQTAAATLSAEETEALRKLLDD
ncbi:MAG: cytochrome c-type biogenesis protein CcmH [Paracoccaceae bacterium]|nr:cytochrome c-type biogenesis protein CcmH [Paracoccaceae bacterium]